MFSIYPFSSSLAKDAYYSPKSEPSTYFLHKVHYNYLNSTPYPIIVLKDLKLPQAIANIYFLTSLITIFSD